MNRIMKRNAKEIAPASKSRCYNRAISTMRLALGYKTGLPKGWAIGGCVPFSEVLAGLAIAFPEHNTYLCVAQDAYDKLMARGYQRSRIHFMPSVLGLVTKRQDDFLWAFQYQGNKENHVVLGVPWDDNGYIPLKYGYVIGVQL